MKIRQGFVSNSSSSSYIIASKEPITEEKFRNLIEGYFKILKGSPAFDLLINALMKLYDNMVDAFTNRFSDEFKYFKRGTMGHEGVLPTELIDIVDFDWVSNTELFFTCDN